MSPIWTKSKWKAEELNEKTVQCTFKDKGGKWETIGKLVVEQKDDSPNEISVEVWIQEVNSNNQLMLNRIALPGRYVEKIGKSDNPECDFILSGEMNLVPGEE
jgi:hypothetical protein